MSYKKKRILASLLIANFIALSVLVQCLRWKSRTTWINPALTKEISSWSRPNKKLTDRFENLRALTNQTEDRKDERIFENGRLIGIKSWLSLRPSNATVYNQFYKLDEFGRRYTPNRDKSSNKVAILIGSSELFGVGLPENETLSYFLSARSKGTDVINLGAMGAGINDNLLTITDNSYPGLTDIKNKTSHVIYFFYGHMLNRITCPLSCFYDRNKWMQKKHYLTIENGSIKDHGPFFQNRPIKNIIYRTLAAIKILDSIGVDIPPRFSRDDVSIFMAIFQKIIQSIQKKTLIQKSTIIVLPGTPKYLVEMLKDSIVNSNNNILDLSEINLETGIESVSVIPYDGHPSAVYNDVFAQVISRYLTDPDYFRRLKILY